jgi:hypothetical protein
MGVRGTGHTPYLSLRRRGADVHGALLRRSMVVI